MLRMLDLFSGIGGFSLAAHWTQRIETIAFCEIDPYARRVLNKNFPGVPVEKNIKELFNFGQYGKTDIICGGFPCQPFSVAGKKAGRLDDRDLWPEMLRVIKEFKPTWIIGENVANFVNMELERTCTDLEAEGYETQSLIIPACSVDAKHERKRVWIVAHRESFRRVDTWPENRSEQNLHGLSSDEKNGDCFRSETGGRSNLRESIMAYSDNQRLQGRDSEQLQECSNERAAWSSSSRTKLQAVSRWKPEPPVGRVADGIPSRVDRLRCLGNSIVPQVVYPIFQAILEQEAEV